MSLQDDYYDVEDFLKITKPELLPAFMRIWHDAYQQQLENQNLKDEILILKVGE